MKLDFAKLAKLAKMAGRIEDIVDIVQDSSPESFTAAEERELLKLAYTTAVQIRRDSIENLLRSTFNVYHGREFFNRYIAKIKSEIIKICEEVLRKIASIPTTDDESKDFYANMEVEFQGYLLEYQDGEVSSRFFEVVNEEDEEAPKGLFEYVTEEDEESTKIESQNKGVLANLSPVILQDTTERMTRALHLEELLANLPGQMVVETVDRTTFLFSVLQYDFCLTLPETYPTNDARIKCLSGVDVCSEEPVVDEEGYVILDEGLTILSAVREVFMIFCSLDSSSDDSEKNRDLYN
ncbi:unnamed protein product [Microthlaspi erraticum]|uniref:14-3-3 domain-containing protein n=1 Tax=Microthlaspi erraticum TaxID=1685480 RepID=A0A6D2JG09_9BRAS|nr:unnamed protein product [Microthlaspi erraticum]